MSKKIKAGLDRDGRPYINMKDPYTAKSFLDQGEKFKKVPLYFIGAGCGVRPRDILRSKEAMKQMYFAKKVFNKKEDSDE